jgi:hypothetical protein
VNRDDNACLDAALAACERNRTDGTITKYLCAVIVWGLLMIAGILAMHLG